VETLWPAVFAKEKTMGMIEDPFGRRFPYLRLSVTDVCNFRCTYCLPDGYQKTDEMTFLTLPEIRRLVTAFAEMGMWKLRLTGGEPTVRKDFLDIVQTVAAVDGVRKLALTTNGYKLPETAQSYYDAGLRAINISIDSLKPGRFHEITGHDRLDEVLGGVAACEDAGYDAIKINAVLMKNVNDDELDGYLGFVKDRDVSLRFIELMRTHDNQDFFTRHHISADVIRRGLEDKGWRERPRVEGAGPAIEFAHDNYKGTIGLIAPYAKDFCKSCNRLRVSARGALHLCLFGEGGYSLRDLLQSDDQKDELKDRVHNAMQFKRGTHFLHQGDSGTREHLASIGG